MYNDNALSFNTLFNREDVADKCPNCGAPVYPNEWGSYKCQYCGTTHQGKFGIEVTMPGCARVKALAVIPKDILRWCREKKDLSYIEEQIKHQLANSLADGLVKYLLYSYNDDMLKDTLTIEGSIQIKADERFYDKQFGLNDLHRELERFIQQGLI